MVLTFFTFVTIFGQAPDTRWEWAKPEIVREINSWKHGGPPPGRLLQFPNGPRETAGIKCGFRCFGDSVEDYIFRIDNTELLQSLLFNSQADQMCIRATIRRLVELHGVKDLRLILTDKRKSDPSIFTRPELSTLLQLLTSSYAHIHIACVDKKDVEKDVVDKALNSFKSNLTAGLGWKKSYGSASDQLIDKVRSKHEGGSRTFLCYKYDGTISPIGFDLISRNISNEFHPEHIRTIFQSKAGAHRLESTDSYWLYYVEAFYE